MDIAGFASREGHGGFGSGPTRVGASGRVRLSLLVLAVLGLAITVSGGLLLTEGGGSSPFTLRAAAIGFEGPTGG